jgi:hypothetical protein
LVFRLEVTIQHVGITPVGSLHTLRLWANKADPAAPYIVLDVDTGSYEYELHPLEIWAPLWATYSVELSSDASLLQVPAPPYSSYEMFRAGYQIDQEYGCLNIITGEGTSWIISSYTKRPDEPTKCETAPGDLRSLCYAGKGVNSLFYKSTPLGSCNGCSISDYDFQPPIDTTSAVDVSKSGGICICATGGTGDYQYSIASGTLPSGQSLNKDTGCVEGSPDLEFPGTPEITWMVTDSGSNHAAGELVTIAGTCWVDGTQVIWASGGLFFAAMTGHFITINGETKTVIAVQDQYDLTAA